MFELSSRRAAALVSSEDESLAAVKASSPSGPTMMRLYSQDDNPGLKVLVVSSVSTYSLYLHVRGVEAEMEGHWCPVE